MFSTRIARQGRGCCCSNEDFLNVHLAFSLAEVNLGLRAKIFEKECLRVCYFRYFLGDKIIS